MPILSEKSTADYLPEELIQKIFSFLTSPADFATASLLNKHWYAADASYRRFIKVGNCFAVSPRRLTRRFHALTSVTLIGRPDVHAANSKDIKWRFSAYQWIECLATSFRGLQVLKLKRFVLSHRLMSLISQSFPDLRSLVFIGCRNIPIVGLGVILRNCRHLEELELRNCSGMEKFEPWLSGFPGNCESLLSLSFVDMTGEIDKLVLESLVSRYHNLKRLRFDVPLPLDVLTRILEAAPQLIELGLGSSMLFPPYESRSKFIDAVMNCTSVQSLSGAWCPDHLILLTSLCSKLLFLDLTKMIQRSWADGNLVVFLQRCHNLQRLWVLDSAGDKVLQAVGRTCKDLLKLKVIPRLYRRKLLSPVNANVTDAGLATIALGCQKLQSVTYSCQCMSNAALVYFAQQNPDLRRFELILNKQGARDTQTSRSFDDGFGAILQSCKNLNYLSICNAHVTDQVFLFAGMFGAQLKKLSVTFEGDSNVGIFYALNLCANLTQLEIRGTPFGDATLLAAAKKFNNLQYVWVCSFSGGGGCKTLRVTCSTLSVDIMDATGKIEDDLALDMEVQNLLIYHRLDEPLEDQK
ncbi:hypothetical protein QQ045_015842 [Rhodiola kirilowii]